MKPCRGTSWRVLVRERWRDLLPSEIYRVGERVVVGREARRGTLLLRREGAERMAPGEVDERVEAGSKV